MFPTLRFGDFEVDPVRRVLTREGQAIDLRPKSFSLLWLLLNNRERVVPKDEILESVWPDGSGTEANLTVNVAAVRRALGENPREHRYLLTVPTVGYRFVGEVRTTAAESRVPLDHCRTFGIAELRVVTDGAEDELHELARRATESIAGTIAALPGRSVRRVLAPTDLKHAFATTPSPATAGDIEAMILGSIQVVGSELSVEIAIFTVADGRRAWSGRIVHAWRDRDCLPIRLQRLVLNALRTPTAPGGWAERGNETDDRAVQAALQGDLLLEGGVPDLDRASACYRRALLLDERSIAAHVGLGESLLLQWGAHQVTDVSVPDRVRELIERAIESDPLDARARAVAGLVRMTLDHDWSAAREQLLAAVDFGPHQAITHDHYALFLAARLQPEAALHAAQRAQELDPDSPRIQCHVALIHYFAGDLDAALAVLDDALARHANPAFARELRPWCLLGLDRPVDALEALRDAGPNLGPSATLGAVRIAALSRAGDRSRAASEIPRLEAGTPDAPPLPALAGAVIRLSMDDPTGALLDLERAAEARAPLVVFAEADPFWRRLHGHAEWPSFARRVFGRRRATGV
ncbi:MAG TPA: winged helix-turn-helix domain-containing protein [Candidatus Krumholzibacteria bacterium]|nr:winged helix-turn-helix domain-containing protein [Candidatus Krumholzibacteria bacterium]